MAKLQLYITPTSPYARMVQILVLEKGLSSRVEIIEAKTRSAASPYYAINPSGRVPYLSGPDGLGLEESALISRYLDHLDGRPRFDADGSGVEPWALGRLEALARSMLDGLAVWARELRRPEAEQSPSVIAHERDRSRRMADLWEREITHPLMQGDLNHAQLALIVTLELDRRLEEFAWRGSHPALSTWADRLALRASVESTRSAP